MIEKRLWSALQYLNSVSHVLAAGAEIHFSLEQIAALSVPTIFEAVYITATTFDGLSNIEVSCGNRTTENTFGVPLLINGEVRGSVCIWTALALTQIDQLVACDLALRIQVALDNAYVLARQRHVADTLQRALLPITLPQKGCVVMSAAYRPATDEATVGGDWYDVFELPDGRTAFSIGDVTGHGLNAAVIMGEVRQAFRAAAVNPKSPALVLERANTIVNTRANPVVVTAIFGIIDPLSLAVTYAVAGHPPPIIAPMNGPPEILPAMGIPLGVAERLDTCDWTMTLAPGSILALYTDGLIEHSHDILSGEAELLATVGVQVHSQSHTPAQNIVDAIFAHRKNVDDAATLVLRADGKVSERFVFEFSPLTFAVPILRRALALYAQHLKLTPDLEHALLLCVGEAAANAVEHACIDDIEPGVVHVQAQREGDNLIVEVRNNGSWKAATERNDERGRGIPIIRSLCNHLEIKTTQTETLVRITLEAFR